MIFQETTFDKIDLPTRLYKYRSWKNPKHKLLLTDSQIYFASPFDCEEQHECNLPTDYDSITEKMIYDFSYKNAHERGHILEKDRHEFAKNMIKNSPFYDKTHRVQIEEEFRKDLNKKLSIFCACEQKDNSNLWSSFAAGHKGFCVGLNTKKMFNNKEIFGAGGKVEYYPIDSPPKVRALSLTSEERLENMMQIIFSLPDIYKNENEYRLTKMNLQNKPVKIYDEAIEEIILGDQMSIKEKEEIIKISKDRLPNVELIQAVYNDKLSTYHFEKIT